MGVNSISANPVQTIQLSARQVIERRPPPALETQSRSLSSSPATTQVSEALQTTDQNQRVDSIVGVQI